MKRRKFTSALLSLAMVISMLPVTMLTANASDQEVLVSLGKSVTLSHPTGNNDSRKAFFTDGIISQQHTWCYTWCQISTQYYAEIDLEEVRSITSASVTRQSNQGGNKAIKVWVSETKLDAFPTEATATLLGTAEAGGSGTYTQTVTPAQATEGRYIYLTGAAGNTEGIVEVMVFANPDAEAVDVLAGKTGTASWGGEMTNWTDGDANELLAGYNGTDWGLPNNSYVLYDLGTPMDLKYFYCSPTRGSDYYLQQSLYVKASNTNDISTATTLIAPFAPTADRGTAPPNGYLKEISGKYQYIWVGASPAYKLCIDDVRIYGCPPEYILGEWTVNDNGSTVTATLPIEYITSEAQMFTVFMVNYDSEGKMVGNPVQADIERQDEVADDDKETQTFTISSPYSVSIDHSQVVVLDENSKLIAIHNEAYGGEWNGFNKDKGTSDTFEDSVNMSVSAEYPFDDQSATVSGKAVAEDDLIMIQVIPQVSTFAIDQYEVEGFAYLAFAKAENGYEFRIPINDAGVYTINVSRTAANGTGESKEFVYEVKDADDIKAAINAFFPTDETPVPDYSAALDNAIDTVGIIGEVDLVGERAIFENDDFAEHATEIAKRMAVVDEQTGNIAMNTSELLDVLNTMVVVYKLSEGDVSVMDEYGEYITGNADVQAYVAQNLPYSLAADVNCQSDMAGLTNLGESGAVKFTFTEEMNPDSLTTDTIILTKGEDVQNYEIVKNDGENFWVDLSSLDANSDYTITFTTECKTTNDKCMLNSVEYPFSTGKIVDAPYKEGKIIKNVILNKPILKGTGAVREYNGAAFSCDNINVINDGDAATNGISKVTSLASDVIIDLEGYYDIVAISHSYYMAAKNGNWWYHAENNDIYAAANPTLDAEGVPTDSVFRGVLLANTGTTPSSFLVPNTITAFSDSVKEALEDEGSVRYIAIKLGRLYHLSEIEIYAYVDIEATNITVDNETVDTENGSSHTFTTEVVDNNASDMTPYMLAFAYDENGNVTAKDVKALTNGTNTATVNAPAGSVGAYAVIVEDLSTMVPLVAPKTIGAPLEGGRAKKTGAYIDADIDHIEVGAGVATDDKAKYNLLALIIQASDSDYASPDEFFETLTRATLMSSALKIAYVGDANAGYTFEGLEEGEKYYVQAVASTVGGSKKTVARHKQAILSVSEKNTIVNDVMSSNGEDLVDAVTDAVFVEEAVAKNLIYDVDNLAYTMDDERFVQILGYTKDMMAAEDDFEASLPAIADIINAAQTIYAIDNADTDEATELLAAYGALLGDSYTTEANLATMLEIYANHDDFTSAEAMKNAINWSAHLSLLKNTNDTEFAEVINDYANAFGVDLNYAKNKKVSLTRVGKYFDRANLEEIYGQSAFNAEYESAVKKAAAAASEATGSKTQTGTFGGLGGGVETSRGESSKPASTPKPVATPEPAKSGFADMQSFAWADEAVAKLVQSGVINGNEKGEFEPSRNVTRGEFVKMLIVASKIKVDEGTSTHFVDVPDSSWQHPYVQIAFSRGICRGVDDFTFNVNGAISRQDMAVMITNLLKNLSVNTSGDAIDFTDVDAIADYAVSAVDTASKAGLINGFDDGSFRPRDNTRRVDAAMVISKLMEKIN